MGQRYMDVERQSFLACRRYVTSGDCYAIASDVFTFTEPPRVPDDTLSFFGHRFAPTTSAACQHLCIRERPL
jgi:hypothetical protein